MKESALKLGETQSLVGILTEDGTGIPVNSSKLTGVLLLNAGLVHHVGPHRIYVKIARLLAAEGFVVLRFDFSGIGDSGPRMDKLPAEESVIDEVRQAMDYLEQAKGVKQFCCIGLCAGAAISARVSVVDNRAKKAILINPTVPKTQQTHLMREFSYYQKHAWYKPRSWLRFLLMKSSYSDIWRMVRFEIQDRIRSVFSKEKEPKEISVALRSFFRSARARGVQLLMLYSEEEIGDAYFRRVVKKEYNMMKKSGLLSVEELRGADHIITPLACQEKLLNHISKWLSETP